MKEVKCECGSTNWIHKHRQAHGIPGTHMIGSEYFECAECKKTYFKTEGEKLGHEFKLD